MTCRAGWRLLSTASAVVALGPTPAWGEAADASANPPRARSGGSVPPDSARASLPRVLVLRPQEELLLQVRTDKWILDEAFSGYTTPTGSYLPLGAFSRLLDFAIVLDGDLGRGGRVVPGPEEQLSN